MLIKFTSRPTVRIDIIGNSFFKVCNSVQGKGGNCQYSIICKGYSYFLFFFSYFFIVAKTLDEYWSNVILIAISKYDKL